jgi:hypothetical protein
MVVAHKICMDANKNIFAQIDLKSFGNSCQVAAGAGAPV